VIDAAVPATCTETGLTEGKHCSVCAKVLVAQTVTPALGHSYAAVVTEPTCTAGGFTTYTCAACGDRYTADPTDMLHHWYGEWKPNADATHTAKCRRCGVKHTVDCTLFELTIGEEILTVCPVCGEEKDRIFEIIADGDLLIRGFENPYDGVLFAFTAARESAGKALEFKKIMTVSFETEMENFQLVRVDVSFIDGQRTEVWTEVEYALEDGVLSFEAEAAALYLMLPAA